MGKVTLYMETTQIEPEKTLSEIQKVLTDINVRRVITDYDSNGNICAFSFLMQVGKAEIPYRVPINHKPIYDLAAAGKTKYVRNEDQARRVAWRQVLMWIKAQIALTKTNMVKPEEVFLPYMMVNNEMTVYEQFLNSGMGGYLLEKKNDTTK